LAIVPDVPPQAADSGNSDEAETDGGDGDEAERGAWRPIKASIAMISAIW